MSGEYGPIERKNLWAPWRIKYIQGLGDKNSECFICHDLKNAQEDEQNFVLWRTGLSIVVLNQFPYNNGHLLIAPNRHIGELEQLNDNELLELTKLIRESQKLLSLVLKPQGFNIGMNFGRCAGAGLPEHLHIHVVPRWSGDANFMNICGDTKVVSQSMIELLSQLKQASKEHNLPNL